MKALTTSYRIGLVVAMSLLGSCTCSKTPEAPDEAPREGDWAIHVWVGADASSAKKVSFGPVPELSRRVKKAASALKVKTTIDTWGGTTTLPDDLGDTDGPNARHSWALLWGAAVECGMRGDGVSSSERVRVAGQVPVIAPWSEPGSWYVFEHAPANCDEMLEYEETLLCVADKLAQVSEDVAPITWNEVQYVPYERHIGFVPPGPWTIPPQASKDRFIARDLAIDVLGHVAQLDASGPYPYQSCSRLYTLSRNDPSTAASYGAALFGAPAVSRYPAPLVGAGAITSTTPLSVVQSTIDGRLTLEAHVLRSAGRMLRDLVRASVYADLAGAEQRAAHALDPSLGAAIAWGEADAENGPYNSLAHAARVLAGRWQLGPASTRNRECGGVSPIGALTATASPDLEARKKDVPITGGGQATATALVEAAGIVLPKATLSTATAPALRGVLVDQLVGTSASKAGVASSTLVTESAATKSMVDALSDSDIRYAFDRGLSTYRLMASAGGTVSVASGLRPGLSSAPYVAPGVASLSGAVVDGGLARTRVAADTTARFAGLLKAAQCNEYQGAGAALSPDTVYGGSELGDPALKGARWMYQDAFMLGQALRARLAVLQGEGALVGLGGSSIDEVAKSGLTELRAWAGTTRVFAYNQFAGGTAPSGDLTVYLMGIDPADLGLASLDDLGDQLRLVWGEAWVAECAARLRTDCPSNIDSAYTVAPNTGSTWWTGDAWTLKYYGLTGALAGMSFPLSGGSGFTPQWEGVTPTKHLYLIARHDPTSKTGRGMVLGSIALRTTEAAEGSDPEPAGELGTSFVVSPMQRELMHAALGVGKWTGERPASVGEGALSKSPDYCIDGVVRSTFVPLENELTSDGDQFESSWRHYLGLAKAAAARADELGQQLVAIGLQKDFRREAAGEALADICGDFSTIDRVKFTPAGKITPDGSDPTLSACLAEQKIDLVFLSDDPTPPVTAGSARTTFLSNVLKCATIGASNPLCKNLASVTTAGLGLAPSTTALPGSCTEMDAVAESLRTGFDGARTAKVLLQGWTGTASVAALLSALRLKVEPNGDWSLGSPGVTVMSSTDTTYWPACLSGSPAGCSFSTKPLNRSLNAVFRACAAAQRETLALGACDAAPEGASVAAETTAILHRVEGALWILSAMTGGVPPSLYDVQIPAADFSSTYWTSKLLADQWSYANAVIGPGRFVFDSPYYHLPSDTNLELRRMVGDASPLAGSKLASISSNLRVKELPDWAREVWTAPNGYRLVRARGVGTTSEPLAAKDLGTLLGSLDRMKCSDPYLDAYPSKEPSSGSEEVLKRVSTLKANAWGTGRLTFRSSVAATGVRSCDLRPSAAFDCELNPDAPTAACSDDMVKFGPGLSVPGAPVPPAGYSALDTGAAALTWVNSNKPCAPCQAAQQLVQALSLACAASKGEVLATMTPTPPPLKTEADVAKLEAWFGGLAAAANSQLGRLYLESIPKRVVLDFTTKDVGTGSKKGLHGQKVVEIREAIEGLEAAWKTIAADVTQLKTALSAARLRIAGAKLDATSKALELFMANLRVQSEMARSVASATAALSDPSSGFASATGVAASVISISNGANELATISTLKAIVEDKKDNDVALAVTELAANSAPLWRDADKALSAVRSSTAQILIQSDQLQQTENKAAYEAAKGAGLDYAVVGGRVATIPVNVVLRRQYDATFMRYQRALKDAKYMAFLARRAIEQRIGTPLSAISVRVGTLDAPAGWADDVCRLSGVDYKRLRYSAGPSSTPAVDLKLVTEFADAFVGDYVTKLENFVEFYNVEYPSHEGDDTAILSLKDDLLPPAAQCMEDGRNILYHSGRLDSVVLLSETPASDEHRWQRHVCKLSDGKCIELLPGGALAAPAGGPGAASADVTWIRDRVLLTGDAGVGDGGADGGDSVLAGPGAVAGGPANMVSQTVKLEPGTYVLSWWDQARTLGGDPASTADSYRVAVYDGSWVAVAAWTGAPQTDSTAVGDAGASDAAVGASGVWSPRRTLTIGVKSSGVYRVGFAPSLDGAPAGSVAIAGVQLERVAGEGAEPTAYVATTGSRRVVSAACVQRSSKDLRAAFQRGCDAKGACYYDLTVPLIVDTRDLGAPTSRLTGKLAAGNFNFRHVDLSLNLVGTGVRECPSGAGASCYGSGYLEFSLQHDGRNSLVIDWAGQARYFDFGIAHIERGKALAAERYITLPIGSADQSLLAQPGILKPELRGRPLEGAYRLRIWDSSALKWDRLEDVQLVLKYRYWSHIDKSK